MSTTFEVKAKLGKGEIVTEYIVEATAAAAERWFREMHKGIKVESIETKETWNRVPATKDQERMALARIKKIVSTLGESSYIATAFAGCFEDAEENIENDFALSMKDRWETSERKVSELEETLAELRKSLAENGRRIASLQEEAEAAKKKMVSADDLGDLMTLLDRHIEEQEAATARAADDIVKYADQPTSREFTEAVRTHRSYQQAVEYSRSLKTRIEAVETSMHSFN